MQMNFQTENPFPKQTICPIHFQNTMKKLFRSCLVGALFLSGCAMHYDITTLPSGDIIRAASKPKLNERGNYVFKDGLGREVQISSTKVRKIEAVNPGDPPSKSFN
jgi:hypothetical protein